MVDALLYAKLGTDLVGETGDREGERGVACVDLRKEGARLVRLELVPHIDFPLINSRPYLRLLGLALAT